MALNGEQMSLSIISVLNHLKMIVENQWEFIITEKPPKPRCRHSAVTYKGNIVIFGGNDSEKSYNDVYVLRQCKYSLIG